MRRTAINNGSLVAVTSLDFLASFCSIFGVSFGAAIWALSFYGTGVGRFIIFGASCIFMAIASHLSTSKVIQILRSRGLCSLNLNGDAKSDKVPEPGSLFACISYIIFMIFAQLIYGGRREELLGYNAGLVSITLMTFMGFIDDVLLLSWKSKIITPFVASLPLCVTYAGNTEIVLPTFTPFVGRIEFDTGVMYYVYMLLLASFCTNSINIYAGINGLEIGQSLIIALFILIYNSIEIVKCVNSVENVSTDTIPQYRLFPFYFILPFIAINISLLCYNWYPAVLFAGNTYTSFAGILFPVISILGNFSSILPLMFIPQIVNFVISLPQLIGIIPCPRHRIPKYNCETDKMEYSENLTLINLVLWVAGPMTERRLCVVLLALQILCCTFGLITKYYIQ